MKPLIDWYCATFKHAKTLDSFFSYFHLKKDDFSVAFGRRFGSYVYQHGLRWNFISVYYNEVQNTAEETYYDICVNFSGQGCREYETLRGDGFDWVEFFRYAMNFANLRKGFYPDTYHVARVDVAYDIKDDSVPDMLKIINYVRLNKFKSKFRKYLPAAGNAEQWVYFGSGQSDTRLRIYNKAMERKREDEGKWIRFEYQLRNKSADRFLCQLLSCENLGQSMKDFLNESVMFTTQPNIGVLNNHHQTRLRPARWWAKLVEGAQKVEKFEVPGIEYNIQGVNRYIENQVAPSLFTKVAVDGGDITALMELILRNKDRLNDKQKALISENDIDVESDSLLRRYNYEWQEIETVDLAKMERRKLYNALRKEFESCPD